MNMKEFREEIIENYMRRWLKCVPSHIIESTSWETDSTGRINVKGDVVIIDIEMSILPFKFGKVDGCFYAAGIGLETLKNCPDEVEGYFCIDDNKLTDLNNAPKRVGDAFFAYNQKVTLTAKDVRKVCEVVGEIWT